MTRMAYNSLQFFPPRTQKYGKSVLMSIQRTRKKKYVVHHAIQGLISVIGVMSSYSREARKEHKLGYSGMAVQQCKVCNVCGAIGPSVVTWTLGQTLDLRAWIRYNNDLI